MAPSEMLDNSYVVHSYSLFADALRKERVRKCAGQLHLGFLVYVGFFPLSVMLCTGPGAPVHARQMLAHGAPCQPLFCFLSSLPVLQSLFLQS